MHTHFKKVYVEYDFLATLGPYSKVSNFNHMKNIISPSARFHKDILFPHIINVSSINMCVLRSLSDPKHLIEYDFNLLFSQRHVKRKWVLFVSYMNISGLDHL